MPKRLISDPKYNALLTVETESHRPTLPVPRSFLDAPPADVRELVDRRVESVLKKLGSSIGRPFFAERGFVLFNGDAQELLPRMHAGGFEVELTATSPPYNIGKEYDAAMTVGEYLGWTEEWLRSVFDVTTPSGALWLNLGYLEVPEKGLCVPIPYLMWDRSPFYLHQEVVWNYGAGVSARHRLSPRNEKWLWYLKSPGDYTFNLDSIRDPNVKYPDQKKGGKYRCNPLGKNPSDVWRFAKVTTGKNRSSRERTSHPAQFPLPLVERIVRAASNPAETVLDPFAGSCSTGIAALALGRVFVGIEQRRDYCDEAAARAASFIEDVERHRSQAELFVGGDEAP